MNGLESHERKVRLLGSEEGKLYYSIEDPVPLQGMKAVVKIPQFEIILEIQCKQIKGIGAHYAKTLTEPNNEHLEIIEAILKEDDPSYPYTQESIRWKVNKLRKIKDPTKKYIRPGSISGRVSELVAIGVLKKDGKFYNLDETKAKLVLENKRF